jgi:general secretion pathway protein K
MSHSHINQKGIALVLILWVLALLSVIAGEFCYAMRTEVNITRNVMEQTDAYYLALAGVNRAIGELIRDDVIRQRSSPSENNARVERNNGGDEADERTGDEDRWRINVDIAPVAFGNGEFQVSIGNESGKININSANDRLISMMVDAFDIQDHEKSIIVDSILDWRDEDNLHRTNGAEDDYYNGLPEPYDCKNDYFDTLEELLLVRGVTPEIYYGGLRDMVTVYPKKEKKVKLVGGLFRPPPQAFETNKINLNAAPYQLLLALPAMTETLAQEIIDFRKGADFRSMGEVSKIVGPDVYRAISPFVTLTLWPYYRVMSVGTVEGSSSRRGMEVLVEVNRGLGRGFRIMEWRDGLRVQRESFQNDTR